MCFSEKLDWPWPNSPVSSCPSQSPTELYIARSNVHNKKKYPLPNQVLLHSSRITRFLFKYTSKHFIRKTLEPLVQRTNFLSLMK